MNFSPDIKIFLIGNKTDLEDKRLINKKDVEKYKEDNDLDFFIETSAKKGKILRKYWLKQKEYFTKIILYISMKRKIKRI